MRTKIACLALSAALAAAGCAKGECAGDEDCNDGLYCSGHERCVNSRCIGGSPPCDDGNPATLDVCDEEADGCDHVCRDRDGDGHGDEACEGGDDCDDEDPSVHPGAEAACQDVDVDCDGRVENDHDGDGAMSPECGGDDCDDEDPLTRPGAAEPCDGIDRNCVDGTDDEEDTDGDGHVEQDCPSSPGGDDCDDEEPLVHGGADEACDGLDNDCDGGCDDGFDCCRGEPVACVTTCGTVGDGTCTGACSIPDAGDCTPPVEICNGADDDCDDRVDEDLPCSPGEIADCETTCGTTGRGVCTDECLPAPPGACNPPREQCNGLDDDCDDVADDGFDCPAGEATDCTTDCGSTGTGTCTAFCAPPDPEDCEPPGEACANWMDDDCDGWADCEDEDCIGTIWCP